MKIEDILTTSVLAAIKDLYGTAVEESQIQLQKTRPEFEGHLTLVVFPLLRTSHKKPEETAMEIGEWLVNNEKAIARYNVIKGFQCEYWLS